MEQTQPINPEQPQRPRTRRRKRSRRNRAARAAQTKAIANVSKNNVGIYGFGSSGVKAAIVAAEQTKKDRSDKTASWVHIHAIDSDGGFLDKQRKLHPSADVTYLPLPDSEGIANGTGGKIEEGEARATLATEQIEKYIQRARAGREIAIMVGCPGGGTIGAMKIFAQKFRDAHIRTIAILCKPDPYGYTDTDPFEAILKDLLDMGVTVLPIENSALEENEDPSPATRYDKMNKQAVGPIITTLRAILQTVADVSNVDDSDLNRILHPGHTLYVGVWQNEPSNKPEPAASAEIITCLTTQPLQYEGSRIIERAKYGIVWANGIGSSKLTDLVNRSIYEKMRGKQSEHDGAIKIKPAINVGEAEANNGKPEPPWFAFITSADLRTTKPNQTAHNGGSAAEKTGATLTVATTVTVPALEAEEPVEPKPIVTTVYLTSLASHTQAVPRTFPLPPELSALYDNLPKSRMTEQEVAELLSKITTHLLTNHFVEPGWKATVSTKTQQQLEQNRRAPIPAPLPSGSNGHHLAHQA